MPGRHARPARRRSGLRWIAGAAGLAVAAATVLATAPAGASTTTTAQLSLSGVADKANILGGTTIGVHPGDTVDFKASALPTAGLDNIPLLGGLVNQLLSPLLGQYQVVVSFSADFPGGARTVTVGGPTSGACKGTPDVPVTFPQAGTYTFSWKVQYVLPVLLGCSKSGVSSSDLNLLKQAGVALNASNQWTGKIVVADNPPAGGISIQLPGVSVAPSLPVVGQLPTVGLPNVAVPTIPVSIPSLPNLLPGGGKTTSPGTGGGSSSGNSGGPGYTPPPLTIPELVMGGGVGGGGGFGGVVPDSGGALQIDSGLSDVVAPVAPTETASVPPIDFGAPKPQNTVELAANRAPAAQLPVLLAILAIIALSLVTATYARLFLLRRNVA